MKRFLAFLLLAVLFLTAGCSAAHEPAPTAENTQAPTAAPLIGRTAEKVREELAASGKRFAVAYLGYMAYGEESVQSFLAKNPALQGQLPLLAEVPDTAVCCPAEQGEVYCILPSDPEATLKVYSWNSLSGEMPVYDQLIYEGTGPEPYILVCNAAYYPDTLLTIDYSDGRAYSWFPQLDENRFVEGYWAGEFSKSEDGYDTLDLSPYHLLLLEQYATLLTDPNSNWIAPTVQDLADTAWYNDNIDPEGNYQFWRMDIRGTEMDVFWNFGYEGEDNQCRDLKWRLKNKAGIAVLTIDFEEFAGERSYNILLDKEAGMLYTAVDATNGPIVNEWEPQYRFLIPAGVPSEPGDMAGAWVREYTYVDGDQQYDEADACTVEIVCQGEKYYIRYENKEFPNQNLDGVEVFVTEGPGSYWLADCQWTGLINSSAQGVTRHLAMNEAGDLFIQYTWNQDDTIAQSYEQFRRPSE